MNKQQLHDYINKRPLHEWVDQVPYERTYDSVAFFYKFGPSGSGGRTLRYPTSREHLKESLELYFCEPGDTLDPDVVDGIWDLLKSYRPPLWHTPQPFTPSLPEWADEKSHRCRGEDRQIGSNNEHRAPLAKGLGIVNEGMEWRVDQIALATTEPQGQKMSNPGILQRTSFRTSRLLDFCSRKELIAQTGHQPEDWPLVVLKELADNSLDEQWTRQRYQFGAPGELAQPPAIREQCPEKRQRSLGSLKWMSSRKVAFQVATAFICGRSPRRTAYPCRSTGSILKQRWPMRCVRYCR